MRVVDACRIERCLFHPWTFDDERLSLRWASVEDRRYALMWDDPGAQEARTIWAASLLARPSPRLLPVASVGGQLGASGFSEFGRKKFFSWPIWQGFLCADALSLLALGVLQQAELDHDRSSGWALSRCSGASAWRSEIPLLSNITFP